MAEPDPLALIVSRLDALESEHRRQRVTDRLDALAARQSTPAQSTTLVDEGTQQPEQPDPEDEDQDVDTERIERPRPRSAKPRPAKRPPRPRQRRPATPAQANNPEGTNR